MKKKANPVYTYIVGDVIEGLTPAKRYSVKELREFVKDELPTSMQENNGVIAPILASLLRRLCAAEGFLYFKK